LCSSVIVVAIADPSFGGGSLAEGAELDCVQADGDGGSGQETSGYLPRAV